MENKILLYIVTGISGSGKTTALKALEDLGFYCVDNIPTVLIPEFIKVIKNKDIAIGIDIREQSFLEKFGDIYLFLKKEYKSLEIQILYLDASDEVIIRRFKETRREHPLKEYDFKKALSVERKKLEFIKNRADIYIDTTTYNIHTLKKFIYNNLNRETYHFFKVNIVSFGFKNGMLSEADLVFDVRFLKNPFFIEELKYKTGKDKEIVEYIFSDKRADKFLNYVLNFLDFLLPEYKKEGKSFIVIGIGCTGGVHRSVAIANKLGEILSNNYNVIIRHRDLTFLEEEL